MKVIALVATLALAACSQPQQAYPDFQGPWSAEERGLVLYAAALWNAACGPHIVPEAPHFPATWEERPAEYPSNWVALAKGGEWVHFYPEARGDMFVHYAAHELGHMIGLPDLYGTDSIMNHEVPAVWPTRKDCP